MKFTDIQNEVVKKYRVTLSDGRTEDGRMGCWSRTHAHVNERKICKWKQANSVQSTFTLLHEIGHIETTKSWMRRAESEYFATVWALDRCKEYGIEVPDSIIDRYQAYIDRERDRGIRRGGKHYGTYKLRKEEKKMSTLKYYKRMADDTNRKEITYEEALNTLLTTYRDNDMTRDMLTIPNEIPCRFSFVYVENDPEHGTMVTMPGLKCRTMQPMDIEYDDDGNRLNKAQ